MGRTLDELQADYDKLQARVALLKRSERRAVRKSRQEAELKPFQVELLKLQKHLEERDERMIVLFEGRDAAGKGGTIRRVTRYMNEKHYRVVALGKPTEEQRARQVQEAVNRNERKEKERRVQGVALADAHGRASQAREGDYMTKQRYEEIVAVIRSRNETAHLEAWEMLRQDGFGEGVNGSGQES